MTSTGFPRWAAIAGELAVLALVCGSWLGGWLSTRSTLADLPQGTRNFVLGFWSTAPYIWLVPVLTAATAVLLVLRYRWPVATFVVGAGVLLFYGVQFPLVDFAEFGSTVALVILSFWATLSSTRVWPIAAIAIGVAALSTARFYGVQENMAGSGQSGSPLLTSITETAGRVIIVAMALAAGWLVRRLRSQTNELSRQNQELEQRRLQATQAAVSEERLRISRELHDVVAHHISAMTIHAGGAKRAMATNTEAANASLDQIAKSGRSAISELQRMLGFLRNSEVANDGARSPSPSLRHLSWLADSYGDDLNVDINTTGKIESLPASVDLSAYRIVQEALTNVVKHGRTNQATVDVTVGTDTTSVSISNPHHGVGVNGTTTNRTTVNGSRPGTGHGLIGMQERVALHQGTLTTGPVDSGSWRVHAVLNHGGVDQT